MFSSPTATTANPLGVKGVGEAGTVGALPAVTNAVTDALGVRHVDMPLMPCWVWRALQDADAAAPSRRLVAEVA